MTAKALWGSEIRGVLERLIDGASSYVLLVSPYTRTKTEAKGLDLVARSIRTALKRGVKVTLIVRAQEDRPRMHAEDDLRELVAAGMQLRKMESLHAKLYMSEKQAVVTSLNLYAPTEDRTLDLGVVVQADDPVYAELREFVETKLRPEAVISELPPTRHKVEPERTRRAEVPFRESPKPRRTRKPRGTCIRCGKDVPLDRSRPLCEECYSKWARFRNEDYEEEFCHACGEPWETSMRKPLCDFCFDAPPPGFDESIPW